jgi:hypothetical protein
MSSYLAFDDFAQYAVGTAATVAFGNFQGGHVNGNEGSFKHEEGGSGQDDIIWDMSKPTAAVQTVYKGETLLINCQRSTWNGMPPQVALWGGIISTATLAALMATAYVNKCKIACGGVGEAVKVDYDFIGLGVARNVVTAGQVATATPTAPFSWQAGAVTIGAAGLICQSFEVNVDNGMTHDSSLDAAAANSQRLAEEIDLGSEKISGSFDVRIPPELDFTLDTPTLPINASIVIGNGYTTRTLTMTGLYVKPFETPLLAGDAKHSFKLDWETKYNPLRSQAGAALSIA